VPFLPAVIWLQQLVSRDVCSTSAVLSACFLLPVVLVSFVCGLREPCPLSSVAPLLRHVISTSQGLCLQAFYQHLLVAWPLLVEHYACPGVASETMLPSPPATAWLHDHLSVDLPTAPSR